MYVLAAFAQQRDSPSRRGVLIIDDDGETQQHLSTLLARTGYRADHCRDPRAAFDLLASGEHGVLIAAPNRDLENGVALVRQVHGAYADVSVILLNEDGTLEGALTALRTGVFDFMTKAFSLSTSHEQFLDAVRRAVQREVGSAASTGVGLEDVPAESGVRMRVQSLLDMELSYMLRVLDLVGGNKASAARLLGVDRTTLYRKLQRQEQPKPAPTSDEPGIVGQRK
jgi:DNA-binding NtrC family response regulator